MQACELAVNPDARRARVRGREEQSRLLRGEPCGTKNHEAVVAAMTVVERDAVNVKCESELHSI